MAAAGPRTRDRAAEYAFVVEAVREGYLCHYSRSRVLADPDPDLSLLAGDLFYAIGISELAALEDLESTGILSDLIRGVAELQAAGEPELAETLWLAQIVALACGKDAALEELLGQLEAGEIESPDAIREWSRSKTSSHGLRREFDNAQTAIDSGPSKS